MNVAGLLEQLNEKNLTLSIKGDELIVQGRKQSLSPSLVDLLRENKNALIQLIKTGEYVGPNSGVIDVPPNRIPPACEAITPDMLPLVELSAADIEGIVGAVPGGAINIQDIYPLAPLQEGILFHHLMTSEGDMYLAPSLYSADSRARLDECLQALQAVIDRHDILRTSILWEGLPEPVQVVWRQARLVVEEVSFDPVDGDVAERLQARFDPRHYRIDVRKAPLMRVFIAHDAPKDRWVVLWLSHHLVSDPITLELMLREVEAHLLGQADRAPAPPPFRNFIAQARLGLSREEHEAFFREMLQDVDAPTTPFGLNDARGDGRGMAQAGQELDLRLARRLRDSARSLSVSAASLFHLAWAQTLARASAPISGRNDVVFGTVLFGRMQGGEGTDRVLGLLMNTLPIRIRVGDEGAQDSVRETHRLLTELLRHEHASLALAQCCSAIAAPAPLFSSLLNYRHAPGEARGRHGANGAASAKGPRILEEIALGNFEKLTNYPLTLNVNDLGEGFVLNVQAQSPVDPSRICAFVRAALERLVEALERAPATPLRALDVLPESERRQMLTEWNATEVDYPREKCLHELIEALASNNPDAIAVTHGDRQITFGEFNAQANRLARYLIDQGVKPAARVAILLDRSIEMVCAQLATLKCGAAFVTLDRNAPDERQTFIIKDCEAGVVLTDNEQRLAETPGVKRVNIDELRLTAYPSINPAMPSHSEAAVHITYTSGSTGQPKGVIIPHRAIGRVALNNGWANLSIGDRFAYISNPAWDANTLEVWAPLLNGACVVAIDQATALAPERLKQCLRAQGVNAIWLTVGLFNQYADILAETLRQFRYLLVGGDALDPRVIARVLRDNPPQRLINGYGPTETTVFATTYEIAEASEEAKSIPIGRPISNTRIYILDAFHQPVPIGVTGEIHIGGAGVALGYLNRPDLTAERFLADPFSAQPGAQMYKSGDLGQYLPDGRIEFMGRNDFQVKIRGFRIELGEIEARLRSHPAIRDAVALAREDSPGDKRLVAYYTATPETSVTAEALRAHLCETLPEFMVPQSYALLEKLPLTPNGKLDRKALPTPEDGAYAANDFEPPASEIETKLAGIWANVLKLDRVGRNDDFFDLGGHSLLAVKVTSSVRQQLNVEIGVTDLFMNSALSEFARAVEKAARSEQASIPIVSRDEPLPLSFAQQRLWFLARMEGVSQAYHIPLATRLKGQLNREALGRALDHIVSRHEALRTTFAMVDGAPVQRIASEGGGFRLQCHDLRRTGDPEGELERLMAEEFSAEFDLETGPLVRGRLIELGETEHALLITMHHIVSDAWSLGVLAHELSALYRAYSRNQGGSLPVLTIQYADYAAWQRRWTTGDALQAQTEYWRRNLADAPTLLDLPMDRPRPEQQDHSGASVELVLDESLTRGLKALSQRHGATLFMTLLTAWGTLMARLSGQDDVVVGAPIANRTRAELEPLIGFFLNTLALRLDLTGSPTLSQALERVKKGMLAAQEHQDLPFEHVVEIVKPPRSLAHSPLFQVMFGWQNNEEGELELPGLELSPIGVAYEMAKFDLTLNLFEAGDRIAGGLVYATALFDRTTVERYLDYFHNLLQSMVADDQQIIGRLQMLSPSERRQLLVEWNGAESGYRYDQGIHAMFEVQAEKTPDALAAAAEDAQLTYKELNSRANRLARHLRALGIGPDKAVAVCVERSLDMLVGLLAILKAGGAYVPLDPAYPAERLAYMLEDSAPTVALTQPHLRDILPPHGAVTFCLDTDWRELANVPDRNPENVSLPDHLAYVIYTSGSTGKPKGVAIAHRALSNFVTAMEQEPGITSEDVMLAVTSLSFDIAGLELYLPLVTGAKVICATRAEATDPGRLSDLVRRWNATMMQATPATWRMILAKDWSDFPPSLKILCGGEALPSDLAEALLKRVPAIWNMYGPTETTIWSTVHRITSADAKLSIGRPIANTQIYILDGYGQPAPIGVAGELCIGGAGLARGYLNRPDLTAERFVGLRTEEHATKGGESAIRNSQSAIRVYKTGDLARYLPSGEIEFLGRLDTQVKIRGFRIELGEIEGALGQHPQVKQCAVIARDAGPGDQYLAAYVVPRETGETEYSTEQTDQITFSLFYFGADSYQQENKYHLYLEAAKFADRHGFEAIWTPERHFHEVGGLYPNPAVLSAALATATERIHLRSGSVVLPLHNPIRVAEEWSVVDNLSRGRVGLSIASGWHLRDFVLAPQNHEKRKEIMASGIQTLKALWRGETLSFVDGSGKPSPISIYPKPVQAELPLWITTSGNPETFIQAGSLGANVLTHLLGQTIEGVAANIALYRESLARHDYDPDKGKVTLMVHAFLGEDFDNTLERARKPFIQYMRSHLGLLESFAKSLEVPVENFTDENLDTIGSFAFERYSRTAALIGSPQTCLPVVGRLREAGVDEIACLIDWMDAERALGGLEHLRALKQMSRKASPSARSLRAHLKSRLPDYMLPASVTFLDQLPQTPNGKLDRKALPAPDLGARVARGYEAPVGEIETTLARIWAETLNLDRVGRHDDFFELGGHSLLAVSLIERMRLEGFDLDVRAFFTTPTVAGMAIVMERIKEIVL